MRTLTWVAELLFNKPLLIESCKLDVIQNVVAPRLGMEQVDVPEHRLNEADKREIYSVTPSGVAVIDIAGTLVNRLPSGVEAMSGLTSYEEIGSELKKALADEAVGGVILRINSGGGEAAGTTTIADRIVAAKSQKPIWAAVDTDAFSAAYWIASAADKIYVPVDGGVGSIGVIARHADQSEFNKAKGIKVTTIKAGARKADFSPHDPLSDEARDRMQESVDEIYGLFVDSVAKNRKMAKKAVRETEALTMKGQKGVDIGLADKIGTFEDALTEMESMLARGGKREEAPAVITSKKSEERKERPIEARQLPMLELRSEGTDEPLITGHIAVFGEWSLDLGGFVERVMPGAFSKTIQEADIHHYFNHDGNIVLGRNKSGTLRLKEDDRGLHIENDPPNTQTVRDLVLEPIRRGDIDQGSFAFLPTRQEWGRATDGKLTRTLHEVRLFHTSIVPRGAYPQTDVAMRALATATGIDFEALAVALAKCTHKLDLSNDEKSLLKEAIRHCTLENPVTPGHAAHLTESATKPPAESETLRYRLELMRRRIVA